MIILGSPASGKTTLARRLMREFSMPCLSKDDVKEALLDHVGCAAVVSATANHAGQADRAGEADGAGEADRAGEAERVGEAERAGEADRAGSRRLSDASFAAVLRLARTQLEAGVSCLIEGNWRTAHAAEVAAILEATGARAAQVWCRARPAEIRRRFVSRTRHPGHLDAVMHPAELLRSSLVPPTFLDLSGPRWTYDSDDPAAYGELQRQWRLWRL